jgi:gamma-glutamylcyclotransferase (GGCT)/AIG2-like uncharacterized protein YtfP
METQSNLFFLYGSLRIGFRDPGYSYLSKYFHFVGEASVNGKFYFNGSTPVAVSAEAGRITGDVYELNDPEDFKWVAVQLDDYEGLNVEPGETPLYKRELVSIELNGSQQSAWIYWYNRPVTDFTELDAGQIAAYLQQLNKS